MRSRYVIQQFAYLLPDDAFSGALGKIVTRILLAFAWVFDLVVCPGDFSVAFMHTPLDEDIYVEPPPELVQDGGVVWKLKKALNGLKKASQLFGDFLAEGLTSEWE